MADMLRFTTVHIYSIDLSNKYVYDGTEKDFWVCFIYP